MTLFAIVHVHNAAAFWTPTVPSQGGCAALPLLSSTLLQLTVWHELEPRWQQPKALWRVLHGRGCTYPLTHHAYEAVAHAMACSRLFPSRISLYKSW